MCFEFLAQVFFFDVYFFFQAEDGIRDADVTGVQTLCSSDLAPTFNYVFNRAQQAQPNPAVPGGLLPNAARDYDLSEKTFGGYLMASYEGHLGNLPVREIGRASCRERVWMWGGAASLKETDKE